MSLKPIENVFHMFKKKLHHNALMLHLELFYYIYMDRDTEYIHICNRIGRFLVQTPLDTRLGFRNHARYEASDDTRAENT